MDLSLWVELSYLFASVLFVVGLKRLQSPATARAGNRLAALAMLIAIVATLLENQVLSWTGIAAGMVLGGTLVMTSRPVSVARTKTYSPTTISPIGFLHFGVSAVSVGNRCGYRRGTYSASPDAPDWCGGAQAVGREKCCSPRNPHFSVE